ncbi:MAG: nucleotidyltransferase domain-containing protein [Clostridium sp.]|jgi:predicted nucleotidyltransferase|uniref:nucleotidyltransferase domain-containing protein n=1 Tax=Clostridium sp. TaxID=1506 RepID=UPI0025C3964A|nr:nucleotidyltransferase domain-containing protein [Clostridium sp.]MCH3962874.1 nucleotidyltransferase domain-containing protein [Clostridium sp.]MCI1715711.1 nucleotidyltransferase domain-containing protein [Clostridium sp.]MCI1800084.1 nucleotidyltransferase domain-containing protein [Clostridium sp.]MCI1813998.1 nucleotidyltransferase domain-containing protein [Clostridium sp.]MCI1870896.1 nucleotidyltransferase domain-containing protein [Clostridium sp.]
MEKTILEYQQVFNKAVEKFKKADAVLAVMVFGSMVTGDLWSESDIDFLIICDCDEQDLKNIYTEENGIPVHVKLMSKNKFLQLNEENIKGGFMHRIISSSRLVFSKDMEVTSRYDVGRYYPDVDREKWSMVYFGNTLDSISVCKKYLQNDGVYTAYSAAVKSVEEFSKLYVNSMGYMISKDAITVAANLNNKFKECVDNLFFNNDRGKNLEKIINETVAYLNKYVDDNIIRFVNVLINYMREKDDFLSSEEIKTCDLFKEYPIHMEEILNKLWQKNIIKKEKRDYTLKDGTILFKENIYFL